MRLCHIKFFFPFCCCSVLIFDAVISNITEDGGRKTRRKVGGTDCRFQLNVWHFFFIIAQPPLRRPHNKQFTRAIGIGEYAEGTTHCNARPPKHAARGHKTISKMSTKSCYNCHVECGCRFIAKFVWTHVRQLQTGARISSSAHPFRPFREFREYVAVDAQGVVINFRCRSLDFLSPIRWEFIADFVHFYRHHSLNVDPNGVPVVLVAGINDFLNCKLYKLMSLRWCGFESAGNRNKSCEMWFKALKFDRILLLE